MINHFTTSTGITALEQITLSDVPLFSTFDPSMMKQKQPSELTAMLKTHTDHYGLHSIVDAESTESEYKCFLASETSRAWRHKIK